MKSGALLVALVLSMFLYLDYRYQRELNNAMAYNLYVFSKYCISPNYKDTK